MTKCPKCSFEPVSGKYCGKCGFPVDTPLNKKVVEIEIEQAVDEKVETLPSIDELEREMKNHPDSAISYINYAKGLQKAGKLNKAFSTFRAAKTIAPDNPDVYRVGAFILEEMLRKEEAIENYFKLLEFKPGDMDAILRVSELLYDTGKKEEALEMLKKLQRKAGEHPKILIKIANVYLSLDNAEEAQKQVKQYKRVAGNTKEMYLMMGKTMLVRKFYDGAIKNFTEGIKVYPEEVGLRLGLGRAYLGMNEKGKALLEFEQALNLKSDSIEILLELGKLQSTMGMAEKSDKTFKIIKKSKLNNGECLYEISKHFSARGNYDEALNYLEHAISLSPHSKEIRKHMGEIFEKKKDFSKALDVYLEASKDIGNIRWINEGIVRCADKTGNFSDKAFAQKLLIELNDTADSWCDYGATLIRLGKFDEAKTAFERAAKLSPSSTRAYQAPELIRIEKARADGKKLAEQAKEAIKNKFFLTAKDRLTKALELVPNEPEWLELLASVALKTSDIDSAAILLAKLRTRNPDNYNFNFNLAKIYEAQGKIQLSVEILTSTLKDHPQNLEAHTMLMRLKRAQIKATRVEKEIIDAMIKNTQLELAHLRTQSNVPKLVEAYANYIFGFKTKYQDEYFNESTRLFKEICSESEDNLQAFLGLSLVKRAEGNPEDATEYIDKYIKRSTDPASLNKLAKFHENFQHYGKALNCYESLSNLFPEDGYYRKKIIEMLANLSNMGGKNELMNFLSERHKMLQDKSAKVWTFYEIALAQQLISESSAQQEEWKKRALLSWHKAVNHSSANQWIHWGAVNCQLKFLSGGERRRAIKRNIKTCERLIRENPDKAQAYFMAAECYLAENDLTQLAQAMEYLEKAWFIDSTNAEIAFRLARTSKKLGKSVLVDFIGYNMVLFEPELAFSLFRV